MNMRDFQPTHFNWRVDGSVAVISLARPERKNPLTFDSYAELRDLFRALASDDVVKAVVIASNGGNFSSGGDVHEIIGPLLTRDMKGLLAFTRMTGDLVKAIRACPQPVIAAVDGVRRRRRDDHALRRSADRRTGGQDGLSVHARRPAGCDIGACAMLPRVVGQDAASCFHRPHMSAGERWGFFNRIVPAEALEREAMFPRGFAQGPAFAHMMTRRTQQEWSMTGPGDQAEAQAQASTCRRGISNAREAFVAKQKPKFSGD
jgi:enoyl-CoA hydratase/carnithine racemase